MAHDTSVRRPELHEWPALIAQLVEELNLVEEAGLAARADRDPLRLSEARRRRREILYQLEVAKLRAMVDDGLAGRADDDPEPPLAA
jgi:hypothetical protein